MIKEINSKDDRDDNFRKDLPEINDELEALVYQLTMLMMTSKGEVLGFSDFGSSIEDLLFTFNANEFSIVSTLTEQTQLFCHLSDKYKIQYNAKFAQQGSKDICLIDTSVNGKAIFGLLID